MIRTILALICFGLFGALAYIGLMNHQPARLASEHKETRPQPFCPPFCFYGEASLPGFHIKKEL
jgi:hypothetical protein